MAQTVAVSVTEKDIPVGDPRYHYVNRERTGSTYTVPLVTKPKS